MQPVGSRPAPRMDLACFGTVRFLGVIGVLLAWFPSSILAWSMRAKRGLAWAWFIHFAQDELVCGFMAIGAITPGGGCPAGSPRR